MRPLGSSSVLLAFSALLAIAIALAYAPVLENDFVAVGEAPPAHEDPLLRLPFDAAWWIEATAPSADWAPLARLSLRIDAALFGLASATPLLLVNVALHALASILLFLGLLRGTGARAPSLFAAALFALHPLRAESVCRLDLRGDLLATALMMFAVWIYCGRRGERMSARTELALLLCMVLGVLASPAMGLLPVLLLVFDVWPLGHVIRGAGSWARCARMAVLEKLPLFTVSIAAAWLFGQLGRSGASEQFTRALDPSVRATARLVASIESLGASLWPVAITSLHSHPVQAAPWSTVALALAVWVVLGLLVVRTAPRRPWLGFGAAWWALASVPALFSRDAWLHEERWVGLALIGIVVMVAFAAWHPTRALGRGRLFVAVAIGVLVGSAMLTRAQVGTWKNEFSVLEHAVAVDPSSWLAHDRLARAHHARDDHSRARPHALRTVLLAPGFAAAQRELALGFELEGEIEAASLLRENAAATGWRDRDADARLGLLLVRCGLDAGAIALLEGALERAPHSGDLHAGLALAHARIGRADQALAHRNQALQSAPVTLPGRILLAWLLATAPEPQLRDAEVAAWLVRNAIDPQAPEPALLDALAASLAQQGAWSEAFETAQQAARGAAARGWKLREAEIRRRGLEYLQRRTWTEPRTRRRRGRAGQRGPGNLSVTRSFQLPGADIASARRKQGAHGPDLAKTQRPGSVSCIRCRRETSTVPCTLVDPGRSAIRPDPTEAFHEPHAALAGPSVPHSRDGNGVHDPDPAAGGALRHLLGDLDHR